MTCELWNFICSPPTVFIFSLSYCISVILQCVYTVSYNVKYRIKQAVYVCTLKISFSWKKQNVGENEVPKENLRKFEVCKFKKLELCCACIQVWMSDVYRLLRFARVVYCLLRCDCGPMWCNVGFDWVFGADCSGIRASSCRNGDRK